MRPLPIAPPSDNVYAQEGPDEALDEYMVDGISQLLPLMNDEMPLLRDTSTWALGRICEHQPDYVFDKPEILHSVVNALGAALTDEPPVAAHACFVSDFFSHTRRER